VIRVTIDGAENLRLSRTGDTLVLKWKAGPSSAWLWLGGALILSSFSGVVKSGVLGAVAIFLFCLFLNDEPPIWRRNLTTAFDLTTRQVHQSSTFGRRSRRYSFDDIAGLGALKKNDPEYGPTHSEIIMRLKSGIILTLGYSSLANYHSSVTIADKISEFIGL
jgi:hypothetical protein